MDIRKTFIAADRAIQQVVDQIQDDQWNIDMPDDFPTFDKKKKALRDVIAYQAYDEAWVPDMVAGNTMDAEGKEKFGEPFEGEILGDDPKNSFAELIMKSIKAVESLDDNMLKERTVHFSYGDFPLGDALEHITVFRGLRVYDLSAALGLDTSMPVDLVEGLWDIVSQNAEEWRSMGIFEDKVQVADDAPLQDKLLGLSGRDPAKKREVIGVNR